MGRKRKLRGTTQIARLFAAPLKLRLTRGVAAAHRRSAPKRPLRGFNGRFHHAALSLEKAFAQFFSSLHHIMNNTFIL